MTIENAPDVKIDYPRIQDDVRGVRYGEVLAIYHRDGRFEAEVFGTQFLNDCPQDLWETLDAEKIAADMGAIMVKLNGPRYWLLDGMGQKNYSLEPVMRDFNGIEMRRERFFKTICDTTDPPASCGIRRSDKAAERRWRALA